MPNLHGVGTEDSKTKENARDAMLSKVKQRNTIVEMIWRALHSKLKQTYNIMKIQNDDSMISHA